MHRKINMNTPTFMMHRRKWQPAQAPWLPSMCTGGCWGLSASCTAPQQRTLARLTANSSRCASMVKCFSFVCNTVCMQPWLDSRNTGCLLPITAWAAWSSQQIAMHGWTKQLQHAPCRQHGFFMHKRMHGSACRGVHVAPCRYVYNARSCAPWRPPLHGFMCMI